MFAILLVIALLNLAGLVILARGVGFATNAVKELRADLRDDLADIADQLDDRIDHTDRGIHMLAENDLSLHRKMTHYIHRRSHRILGLLGDPDDDLDPPKNMTEQEKQLRKSMEIELTAAAREQTPA
jgi:hypothetical protein